MGKRKEKLSILMVRPLLNYYGVSKIVSHLSNELGRQGSKVTVCAENIEVFSNLFTHPAIKFYSLPPTYQKKDICGFFASLLTLNTILKDERINLIHSHHRWSSFIAFFSAKINRIPLLTTYHGIHQKRPFTLWGDAVIAVSKEAKNDLIDNLHVNPKKIYLVRNGITIPEEVCEQNTGSHFTVANIARMSPEKDQETLLSAMGLLIERVPQARLLMVGTGPLQDKLKMRANELGIKENVIFLGEMPDVSSILKVVDCVALSSITEGFPISILEACASSRPVVATSVGDIPEIVLNGKTGFLVPSKNPRALADALITLSCNNELRTRFGQNARSLVAERFSIQQMAKQSIYIYNQIISERSG